MGNILRNSLIASAVAVLGATAFVGKANAQSVDVNFTGNISDTCTINKIADGTLSVTTDARLIQTNSTSASGSVSINCVGTGQVGVSAITFTVPSGVTLTDFASSVFEGTTTIAHRSTGSYYGSIPFTTSNVAFNGTAKTYGVSAGLRRDSAPLPAGPYSLTATVTVTAQ